ncbi:MAG: hypothetical protein SD837_22095 [Candidatus Electrothrix scaldis]|nr:MAG: hypothetical protein SD837_22095 [Candidatus Electrothrix sp. GW3-3]
MKETTTNTSDALNGYMVIADYLRQYKKIFWVCGWLFTLGYSDFFHAFDIKFSYLSSESYFLTFIFSLVFSFFFWPWALGVEMKS